MKTKRQPNESAARAGIKAAIAEAVGLPPPPKAVRRGPEPERLKIRGDWKAAVSKALRTPRPPGGWEWNCLLEEMDDGKVTLVSELLRDGVAVQHFKRAENADIISNNGFTLEWEGLRFLACNAGQYNSLLFAAGLQPFHDACLGFCWRKDKWTVSLYHAPGREELDLSKIAVKHGGGGHKGACGFTCKELPFKLQ